MSLNVSFDSLRAMEIGDKIRRARVKQGLSLEALGKAVGVTRSAVHQWESGAVTNIKLPHRIAMGEILGLSITELLPPEATAGDFNVKDQKEILLVQRFRSMSEPQREAYLRLLLVMGLKEDPPDHSC